jgi:hypothetical protein
MVLVRLRTVASFQKVCPVSHDENSPPSVEHLAWQRQTQATLHFSEAFKEYVAASRMIAMPEGVIQSFVKQLTQSEFNNPLPKENQKAYSPQRFEEENKAKTNNSASFLQPTKEIIAEYKQGNRSQKSFIINDIILIYLLNQRDKRTYLTHIQDELKRFGITDGGNNALTSRLSRMRTDSLLEKAGQRDRGVYRLSADGISVAEKAAKERKVRVD